MRLTLGLGPIGCWRRRADATSTRISASPIDVQRFDGDQAGAMVLDARWTLLAGTWMSARRHRPWARIVEQADDPASWDARVAAMGRALAAFSCKVGEAVSAKTASR